MKNIAQYEVIDYKLKNKIICRENEISLIHGERIPWRAKYIRDVSSPKFRVIDRNELSKFENGHRLNEKPLKHQANAMRALSLYTKFRRCRSGVRLVAN